ncbi:hypothetical protein GCM10009804_40420 [Kribbella hippodromi]|uniref:Fibronectin type-III domain-containing protein n=1 Tax=Kribbella hippodromi TaxID=434347 RepID=A0ABP4PI49_9ACTN
MPADLTATDVSRNSGSLDWRPSAGATSYQVFANGNQVASSQGTSVVVNGLSPQMEYKFTVRGGRTSEAVRPSRSTRRIRCATKLRHRLVRDNDWGTPQVTYLPVKLTAGTNSLKISNPNGYIADIDWITV